MKKVLIAVVLSMFTAPVFATSVPHYMKGAIHVHNTGGEHPDAKEKITIPSSSEKYGSEAACNTAITKAIESPVDTYPSSKDPSVAKMYGEWRKVSMLYCIPAN